VREKKYKAKPRSFYTAFVSVKRKKRLTADGAMGKTRGSREQGIS